MREGVCDVKGGVFLVFNIEVVLLKGEYYILEMMWSRGKRVFEDYF